MGKNKTPITIIIVAAFLFFAGVMAIAAGLAFLFPGTPLDIILSVKREAMAKMKETLGYANWLLYRTLNETNCQRYAIFAARKVLPVFEREYPDDKRPRQAIEAAEGFLAGTVSAEELAKAYWVANANWVATYWAASAACGTESAACGTESAALYAARAAYWAASAAYYAARATDPDTFISILLNGVELLKSQE